MRSKIYSWFELTLSACLYSIGVSFLIRPWIIFFNTKYFNRNLYTQEFLWIIFIIFAVIVLGYFIERMEKRKLRFVLVAGFVLFNILFFLWLNWEVYFFLPLQLFLLAVGFRFNQYYSRLDFNVDFLIGILFLIVNFFLDFNYGFNIGFIDVFVFFLAGISLSIYFNHHKMKLKGYPEKNKVINLIIMGIVLCVSIMSLLFTSLFQNSFIAKVFYALGWIYDKVISLFLLLLYPLFLILSLVIKCFKGLNIQGANKSNLMKFFRQFGERNLEAEKVATPVFIEKIPIIIFYIVVLSIVSYYIYKLTKNTNKNDEIRGYYEERESVFSIDEMGSNFKNFYNGVKDFFNSNNKSIYDRSNPVIKIREVYYKFIKRYNSYFSFNYYYTPREYLQLLKSRAETDEQNRLISELTEIYNRARYREQATEEEALKAKNIFEKIEDNLLSLL